MAGAAFLLDAVRTPFGRYGGALGGVRPVRTTGSSHSPVEAARQAGHGPGRERLAAICIGVGQGLAVVVEA